MAKIEHSVFSGLSVQYGGVFYINNLIDLSITNVQIFNITATSYVNCYSANTGGPGFIFAGNTFQGNNICASNLITSYRGLLLMYSTDHKIYLNNTSVEGGSCGEHPVALCKGLCFAKAINCSRITSKSYSCSFHFGFYPISYHLSELIAINNTGPIVMMNACNDADNAQINKDIILLDNKVSTGVLGFWKYIHKITNAYIRGNSNNKIVNQESCTVIFDECYHDGVTGMNTEENSRAFYSNYVSFHSSFCRMRTFKRYLKTNHCSAKKHHHIFLLIIIESV